MRICVVGIGYVGLVSGACFAECGHEVTCVDVVPEKIAILNEGRLPLYEPGLAEIATTAMHDGRLAFSTDLSAGARGAEVIFVTVGTPSRPSDGHADLSAVFLRCPRDRARSGAGGCDRDQVDGSRRHMR